MPGLDVLAGLCWDGEVKAVLIAVALLIVPTWVHGDDMRQYVPALRVLVASGTAQTKGRVNAQMDQAYVMGLMGGAYSVLSVWVMESGQKRLPIEPDQFAMLKFALELADGRPDKLKIAPADFIAAAVFAFCQERYSIVAKTPKDQR